MKYNEYDDKTLKHLQSLELMILKDFIKICEENNLTYYMYAGSLLGTIRHNGFIPWDDDLDVIMFRDDFEKFKKIFISSQSDKYELLSNETEKDYFHLLSKLMLKNTKFEEDWVNQVDFHIGINMDIFVLDDLANGKFKRNYQLKKSFLYNKLLIMSKIKLNDLPFSTKVITHACYHILNLFGIKPSKINKRCLNFLNKYKNPDAEFVFDISANADEYPQIFRRDDFKSIIKVKFEDIEVNVPVNYDHILKSLYGDYMSLPPKEDRYNHITETLDFGPYEL
ncbi:MAG: LicD family protein [archaeon]|uniref:Lipopolysaccharide cholinephosphotransferase n=1 Tax=Methanobrevibacter gottschalkii DSM 11977 TaxID=1122229 RepID=A0A3N5BPP7_9EURY|nr:MULTISPECIES: LicD family protein [Methanobrevibacter]MCQ2970032.1 LicD family protein [archaeon]OEC98011.1 lipopolysaccharide cholinephosphotransferase [Methanobrevibacter sp. A27]RPF51748.1 lipopolysaccharide cholinephosphotransferase [Methanobrevibacter gottschalkii DSM 11977]